MQFDRALYPPLREISGLVQRNWLRIGEGHSVLEIKVAFSVEVEALFLSLNHAWVFEVTEKLNTGTPATHTPIN